MMAQRFSFQRLEVYQVAKAVAQLLIENRQSFQEIPGDLHARLSKAMLDVLAEIAAGSGLSARAEQRRHYQQACASASEIMSCIELAELHGTVSPELHDHLGSQLARINTMLTGMVRRRTA
jgi:four helix bundle protein